MGSMGGSDGLDVHLQKLLEVDTDHLYRHLTEVNGKDTRVSQLANNESLTSFLSGWLSKKSLTSFLFRAAI